MKMLLMFLLIGTCTFSTVRSDHDYIESLSDLGFDGRGSKTCDDDDNCALAFSNGYRGQICSFQETDCWGSQGVSEYDDYVTRALYEQEKGSSYDGAGQYIATSVILKSSMSSGADVKYSNILILPPDERNCHAGDMVLTEHNGMLYFLFACTNWILVFNETAIAKYPNGKDVNGKYFYYRVYSEDVIEIEDNGVIDGTAYNLSLSFISRNQGSTNQFWTGRFDDGDLNPNINFITFDFDSMSITAVDPYTVDDDFDLERIQGITRIGDKLLITSDPDYEGDWWDKNGWGDGKNKVSKLTLCPLNTDTRVVSGSGCELKCKVSTEYDEYRIMQGAEVSADGTVYVGSEFGSPRAIWYEFADFDSLDGGACSSWD